MCGTIYTYLGVSCMTTVSMHNYDIVASKETQLIMMPPSVWEHTLPDLRISRCIIASHSRDLL